MKTFIFRINIWFWQSQTVSLHLHTSAHFMRMQQTHSSYSVKAQSKKQETGLNFCPCTKTKKKEVNWCPIFLRILRVITVWLLAIPHRGSSKDDASDFIQLSPQPGSDSAASHNKTSVLFKQHLKHSFCPSCLIWIKTILLFIIFLTNCIRKWLWLVVSVWCVNVKLWNRMVVLK